MPEFSCYLISEFQEFNEVKFPFIETGAKKLKQLKKGYTEDIGRFCKFKSEIAIFFFTFIFRYIITDIFTIFNVTVA